MMSLSPWLGRVPYHMWDKHHLIAKIESLEEEITAFHNAADDLLVLLSEIEIGGVNSDIDKAMANLEELLC